MDDKYEKARKRVKAKKDFYSHLTTYMVMGIFFFLLNAVTSFGNWWFYWPMLGWGIGILFHYFDVFGMPGIEELDEEWEEKAIQKEMKRLEGRSSSGKALEEKPEADELELRELRKEKQKKWDEEDLV